MSQTSLALSRLPKVRLMEATQVLANQEIILSCVLRHVRRRLEKVVLDSSSLKIGLSSSPKTYYQGQCSLSHLLID
jgi:hypothetical protein